MSDWNPDKVQPPEYPPAEPSQAEPDVPTGPRARDMERADTPTAWQRAQAERAAERQKWQEGALAGEEDEELPEAKRAELLRCAEAFEHTAAKLREIVGE